MQTCSLNIDHDYQEPTKELNMLLLNTPHNSINAYGTIDQVTKEGWPRILRQQVDRKSIKTLNDGGSSDQLFKRILF
jgi:hypothetical protein